MLIKWNSIHIVRWGRIRPQIRSLVHGMQKRTLRQLKCRRAITASIQGAHLWRTLNNALQRVVASVASISVSEEAPSAQHWKTQTFPISRSTTSGPPKSCKTTKVQAKASTISTKKTATAWRRLLWAASKWMKKVNWTNRRAFLELHRHGISGSATSHRRCKVIPKWTSSI